MIPPLDIFRIETDGQLVWLAAAETLDRAKLRVATLMAAYPSDYVIFSQKTGHKTLIERVDTLGV